MGRLTKAERGHLRPEDFVFPERRAYPIEDKSHAEDALRMGAKNASPKQDAKIKRVVHKDYPSIKIAALTSKGRRRGH